jgi:hypothetical protein
MIVWGLALSIMTMLPVQGIDVGPDSTGIRPKPVPYNPGEKFTFSVEYGFISAGTATLSVVGIDTLQGVPCYHFQSRAQTNPTFSPIFKVDDKVNSYADLYKLASLRMEKHLREGSYKKDFEVDFDPYLPLAYYPSGDTVETAPDAKDVLSSLYFLRLHELQVGTVLSIPTHNNKKNYPLYVKIERKERVKVPAGKFTCFVVEPFLQDEGIFKAKGKILIWITADEKKMPVLVKASVLIGSVSAKLQEYDFGVPVDLDTFTLPARTFEPDTLTAQDELDALPDSIVSPAVIDTAAIDTLERVDPGGYNDDVTPQDAGSQEGKDISVQKKEKPGKN